MPITLKVQRRQLIHRDVARYSEIRFRHDEAEQDDLPSWLAQFNENAARSRLHWPFTMRQPGMEHTKETPIKLLAWLSRSILTYEGQERDFLVDLLSGVSGFGAIE